MRYLVLIIAALLPSLSSGQEFKVLAWKFQYQVYENTDTAFITEQTNLIRAQLESVKGSFDIIAATDIPLPLINPFGDCVPRYRGPGTYYNLASSVGEGSLLNVVAWDANKFTAEDYEDLSDVNYDQHRELSEKRQPPFIVTFLHKASGKKFHLVNCQLTPQTLQTRDRRVGVLVDWARKQTLPIIAVGNFCTEYNISDKKGSEAFSVMQRDQVFKWIKPTELIDTQWIDNNKDGQDDSESIVDLVFTAGPAKDWDVSTKVVVRDGDFPDDEKTSDHRPTLTTVIVK